MKMEKRGDLSLSHILITVILLIIALAVVLFVYHLFSGGTVNVDREVCHESVIYRATLPTVVGAKDYVPLKCKTKKICITTGILGGDCEGEDGFGKVDDVVKIKVKNEEQISRAIAQEIVECWSTMGEGKVSIFSQWLAESYGVGEVYPTCVICSRIAFDKSLEGFDFEKINVMDYMMRYKMQDKDVTYYDYLVSEGGKVSAEGGVKIMGDLEEEQIKIETEEYRENLEELGERNSVGKTDIGELSFLGGGELGEGEMEELNKKAEELSVVFTQISAPNKEEVLLNTIKAGTAMLGLGVSYKPGAFIGSTTQLSSSMVWDANVNRFRYIKGTVIEGTKVGGRFTKPKYVTSSKITPFTKILAFVAILGFVAQQGNVALNREITAGYCGDVSYGDDAREGCSVVRVINYNREDISQYCSVIESID